MVRRPFGWSTLTTPTPATRPANATRPAPAANTVPAGVPARSTPRCPGSHGCGGSSSPHRPETSPPGRYSPHRSGNGAPSAVVHATGSNTRPARRSNMSRIATDPGSLPTGTYAHTVLPPCTMGSR